MNLYPKRDIERYCPNGKLSSDCPIILRLISSKLKSVTEVNKAWWHSFSYFTFILDGYGSIFVLIEFPKYQLIISVLMIRYSFQKLLYLCDSRAVLAKHGDDSASNPMIVWMTRSISYLPMFYTLDPDNRSIFIQSRRMVNKRSRQHN